MAVGAPMRRPNTRWVLSVWNDPTTASVMRMIGLGRPRDDGPPLHGSLTVLPSGFGASDALITRHSMREKEEEKGFTDPTW